MLPIDPEAAGSSGSGPMRRDAVMAAPSRTLAEAIVDELQRRQLNESFWHVQQDERREERIAVVESYVRGLSDVTRQHRDAAWVERHLGVANAALRQRVHRGTLKRTQWHGKNYYLLPDLAEEFPQEFAAYEARAVADLGAVTKRNASKSRCGAFVRSRAHDASKRVPRRVVVRPPFPQKT